MPVRALANQDVVVRETFLFGPAWLGDWLRFESLYGEAGRPAADEPDERRSVLVERGLVATLRSPQLLVEFEESPDTELSGGRADRPQVIGRNPASQQG